MAVYFSQIGVSQEQRFEDAFLIYEVNGDLRYNSHYGRWCMNVSEPKNKKRYYAKLLQLTNKINGYVKVKDTNFDSTKWFGSCFNKYSTSLKTMMTAADISIF